MKKLTSAIVASSLVFSLVGTAAAAYTPAAGETAGTRMQTLKIVQGKGGTNDLALNDEITRAELVTVIVRAFGQEENAKLLAGSAAFPDTATHWASGNIAMAKALVEKVGGDAIGMDGGKFNPDGKLTPAQAVAFLMKFLGVKADPAKVWPANYLDKAVEMGLITAEDKALVTPMANTNATRGLAFYLFDRAFYSYTMADGKTFYTKYVDMAAPELTLKNDAVSTTQANKVTVTGTVTGAAELYVGSTKVTADANGNFSADVALPAVQADPYKITVTARDVAGNKTEKSIQVTRTVGTAASIEAGDVTVAAGATADVTVAVKDAQGNVLAGQMATGTSTVGTFADGKFVAGKVAGTGKLTLTVGTLTKDVTVTVNAAPLAKVVPSAESVKVGAQVTFTAQDEFGNAITGVTYTVDSVNALMDSTKGIMVASKAATYTVTGAKDGKSVTGTVGVYSTDVAKLIVSAPATMVGNTDTTLVTPVIGTVYDVTVKATDSNGNLVANYTGDIVLTLPEGFSGNVDDTDATIVTAGGVTTITKAATTGAATFKVQAESTYVGRQFSFGATTNLGTVALPNVIGDASNEITKAKAEVVEQVATSVKISTKSTAQYIASNDADNKTAVKVYVADQNGMQYIDATGFVVNLSVAGAATIGDASNTHKTSFTTTYSGSRLAINFESIKGVTGDATLTASVDGLGTATAKVTAAVAQAPTKLSVKADITAGVANDIDTVTYDVQAVDANGVQVTGTWNLKGTLNTDAATEFTVTETTDGASNAVAVTADATNDISTFPLITNASGHAKFTLTAMKYVGDLKLTMSDTASSSKLTAADATVSFKADVAKTIGLTRIDDIKVGYAAPKATIVAQAYDDAGNKAMVAGKKVTFKVSAATGTIATTDVTLNGTAEKLEVTTDANGKATVETNVAGYAGDNFTVVIDKSDLSVDAANDTILVKVDNAVASTLSYTLKDDMGNVYTRPTAGSAVTIVVTAKDAAGKLVKDAAESIVFVPAGTAYRTYDPAGLGTYSNKIDKTDGYALDAELDVNSNPTGNYTLTFYPGTAGNFGFTLKDLSSGTALEQAGTARVVAGTASKFVANDGNLVTIDQTKASGALVLKLTDRFGNSIPAKAKITAAITAENGTYDEVADTWTPAALNPDTTGMGIRTSLSAPDVTSLDITAGASSTTFYVWNSLAKTDYKVTFTYTSGGTTYTGDLYVRIK